MGRREKHSAKKTSKYSIKRIILIIIEFILIGVMIYSGYKIFEWIKENNESKELLEEVSAKVTIVENEDTVGWIKIENMPIEYPVVKAENNEYYLTHSFDKSSNGAGWVFMDYRNKADETDRNLVIYGHNRKDGSMFGDLSDVFTEEWYENKDNMYITYITENEYCTYQIFSAYRIEAEDYYITTGFDSNDEFDTFVKRLKSRSFKDFEVEVSGEDKILTLSTCSNANYRVAVHAKKIVDENNKNNVE